MVKVAVKVTLFALAFCVLWACNNAVEPTTEVEVETEVDEKNETTQPEDEHTIVLNNGDRWQANAETTEGVNNMIGLMNAFSAKDSAGAYAALSANLQTEFNQIFKKCTMTGEAHNQLHNFLIPIKDLFPSLASAELNECQASFEKLNEHLGQYEEYFE